MMNTRCGWSAIVLAGLALSACATAGDFVRRVDDDGSVLFTCPDQADARTLRMDRRETDAARAVAPTAGGEGSTDLYFASQLSAAAYAMYAAYDDGREPSEGAPEVTGALGLVIEAYIFGEPGRATERRGRRRRANAPTFYGFVASDPRTRVRYVTFRGTLQAEEWVRNVQLRQVDFPQGGGVHKGFYTIYETLRFAEEGVRGDFLTRLGAAAPPAPKTVFIGHSLGGALASIAAIDASDEAWSATGERLALTTFASPRAGDPAFAELAAPIPEKTRVCNVVDLVPGTPFSTRTLAYAHVGEVLAVSSFDYDDQLENTLESRGDQILCWHSVTAYGFMVDPEGRAPRDNSCFRDTGS